MIDGFIVMMAMSNVIIMVALLKILTILDSIDKTLEEEQNDTD